MVQVVFFVSVSGEIAYSELWSELGHPLAVGIARPLFVSDWLTLWWYLRVECSKVGV
jgi:hypothetical protein